MTVLIVDDSVDIRRTIRTVIQDIADEIHDCPGGAEAIAACRRTRPDWVLMDIEMPGMDGLTASLAITAAWPGVRICVVTQYDDDGLRTAAVRAGACGYVLKDNLLDLRQVLRGQADGT